MGERGRAVHLRRKGIVLMSPGTPCEVVAYNKEWSTLVPRDAEYDKAALAAAERADVVEVWFDDDAGVALAVAGADGFAGELSVPFFEEDVSGVEDERFIDAIAGRGLLSATAARTLKRQLKGSPEKRDAWVRSHGVEKVFGFPSTEVAPTKRAKKARAPARAKAAPARSEIDWKKPLPRRHRLPDEARPTLGLHVFYWTEVWSMNSYALYTRYKKHLPASDRRLVDELCNASAMGHTKEIRSRVEYILQKTWQAEDWAAFIRSPKLDDSGTHLATARRWREMTGRG